MWQLFKRLWKPPAVLGSYEFKLSNPISCEPGTPAMDERIWFSICRLHKVREIFVTYRSQTLIHFTAGDTPETSTMVVTPYDATDD
jgi:hypothetical protein